MALWGEIVQRAGLVVDTREGVERITARKNGFNVVTPKGSYRAKRVVMSAFTKGDVEVLWQTNLLEITPTGVRYRDEKAGTEQVVPKSIVLIFAGGELPTAFLASCGVQIDTKFGAPR